MALLLGSLDSLSRSLCPELGNKGSIDHERVTLENLSSMREELIDYLKKDVLLLGGVMQRAQEIFWEVYEVDIVKKITISSLAMYLFRMKFHDPAKGRIHIPNTNEERFIRRGYYGGHVDAYIPIGKDLYYYDVNSLYPFVMAERPMPAGKPVWREDLGGEDLDSLFGFIEAYVECPKTIKKPFLPYRSRGGPLGLPYREVYRGLL
nr:hypothetical protein [Solanum melongena]WMB97040.1 hypothetical protein [Solanum aethiopicum]